MMTDFQAGVIGTAIYVIFGILFGAYFTDYISTNLPETEWANLMTYVWITLWPLILVFKFLFWVAFFGICWFIGWCVYQQTRG